MPRRNWVGSIVAVSALWLLAASPCRAEDAKPQIEVEVVSPGSWQSPTIISNQGNTFYGAPTPFLFNNGGSATTIYGYLVYDSSGPTSLYAELFSVAQLLNPGDQMLLTLNFKDATL